MTLDGIQRRKVTPEEIDNLVHFVQEELYEFLKNEGIEFSKKDTYTEVKVQYFRINMDCEECGRITVYVSQHHRYSSCRYIRFYYSFHAKESFEDYEHELLKKSHANVTRDDNKGTLATATILI